MEGGCSCCLTLIIFFPLLLIYLAVAWIRKLPWSRYRRGVFIISGLFLLAILGQLYATWWDSAVQSPLYDAVWHHDTTEAERLLQRGADPNDTDNGFCLLENAASEGDVEMVRLLLRHGARVTEKDRFDEMTPLQAAKKNGHTEIMKMLRKAGAKE